MNRVIVIEMKQDEEWVPLTVCGIYLFADDAERVMRTLPDFYTIDDKYRWTWYVAEGG